ADDSREPERDVALGEVGVDVGEVAELLLDLDLEYRLEPAHRPGHPREHARGIDLRRQAEPLHLADEGAFRRGTGAVARRDLSWREKPTIGRGPRPLHGEERRPRFALGPLEPEVEGDAAGRGRAGRGARDGDEDAQRQGPASLSRRYLNATQPRRP